MYIYEQIAQYVNDHPGGVGRAEVSRDFRISKGTALYHLEKCAERGLVRRGFTWVNKHARGWVYFPVTDVPQGLTLDEEIAYVAG